MGHRIEYAAKAPADDPAVDEKRCDAVTFANMHLPRKDPMVALIGSGKGAIGLKGAPDRLGNL